MIGFGTLAAWRLPKAALRASIVEMVPDGARGCEGVALWLGRKFGPIASITHVVSLRGPGIVKRPDHLSISAELLNELTDVATDLGVYLVGQIHSHPSAWVDLSEADKRFGIQADGYLSVVAPYFASKPDAGLSEYGFHAYEGRRWHRMGPVERSWRVRMTSSVIGEIVVGEGGR